MASAGNWFETERKAYKLRTKAFTTSSGIITYTAKVGGASNNFVVDSIIQVTTTSGFNLTITVPNGKYSGQELLIVCAANGGGADTIDTTVALGDDITQITGVSGYSVLLWIDDTNGWVEMVNSAT